MKNLILAYNRGAHRIRAMRSTLEDLGEDVTVVTSDFDSVTERHDKIWTLSESLLPIQAKYDKLWGLNHLHDYAAAILTNKKKFDDFCMKIGLEEIVPYSVIPTSSDDLFNGPAIIKPTIGSGTKINDIAYYSYMSKEELLMNIPSDFFEINKKGFKDPRFNNVKSHYMVQEKLPFESELYAPYYYINAEGNGRIIHWVQGEVKRVVKNNNRFLDLSGCFWVVDDVEVPPKVIEHAKTLFEAIADVLQVRNMFFAGPDFYVYGDNIKYIDCNPRIGQGLQMTNDLNPGILKNVILNNPVSINTKWLWKTADLKPGVVKSIGDYSHLEKYVIEETSKVLKPGIEIKTQTNVSDNFFNFNFRTTGKDKPSMLETYWAVKEEFQSLIEYN